ncbi:Methyl-CpG binding domain protein [Dictyocaulus viviparus]|uniref:Methyl-CpG binding domain protein n=1 Tax=Dictyocaulus viviparus TaxID=29172 RepID=A0A0D8Y483_DICVI|nr:Methyl-CpG binding domain protein [Dictyocaulus viviparus]
MRHLKARKSSMAVRVEGNLASMPCSEMDQETLTIRLEKEAQFEVLPCSQSIPNVIWQYHTECTPVCLGGLERDPADPQFYKCSPLHIPILCGWRRMLYLHESSVRRAGESRIMYRAPCGRSLISKKCIATYLREVGSELTIDLFCFDPTIETKNFVHVGCFLWRISFVYFSLSY